MTEKYPNIKERILHIPEVMGITKQEFFRTVGLQYGNFTGANKDTQIGSDSLAKILAAYQNVNPMWLLTGEGDIFVGTDAMGVRTRERNIASDVMGSYRVVEAGENNMSIVKMVAEDRKVHDEIVVSQQRTIERQQGTIDKLVGMIEK